MHNLGDFLWIVSIFAIGPFAIVFATTQRSQSLGILAVVSILVLAVGLEACSRAINQGNNPLAYLAVGFAVLGLLAVKRF